jgi:hypothetical protein
MLGARVPGVAGAALWQPQAMVEIPYRDCAWRIVFGIRRRGLLVLGQADMYTEFETPGCRHNQGLDRRHRGSCLVHGRDSVHATTDLAPFTERRSGSARDASDPDCRVVFETRVGADQA